jgi:acyl carrier protein phosphodiesterase
MNFLAHLYLAGNDEGLIIGNFIADSIRGKETNNYPESIRRGIVLHRQIDQYTDTHPVVKRTVQRLRKSSEKYAPVVSDVIYDHFLAANWHLYSPIPLEQFANNSYHFLNERKQAMPEKMHTLLGYMMRQNWLVNYGSLNGIAKTLREMQKKVHFANTMASSIIDLRKDYQEFENDFKEFFPEIQRFVKNEISKLGS